MSCVHHRFKKVEHKCTRPFIYDEIVLQNETKPNGQPAVKAGSEVSACSQTPLFPTPSRQYRVQRHLRVQCSVYARIESFCQVHARPSDNANTRAQEDVCNFLERKVNDLIKQAEEVYGDRPPDVHKPLVWKG
jgi:hypothetical protein